MVRLLLVSLVALLISRSVSAQLVISEFRVRGPNGANDAYIELANVSYSLASSPAGIGTTATGDATYTTGIPDNAGYAGREPGA